MSEYRFARLPSVVATSGGEADYIRVEARRVDSLAIAARLGVAGRGLGSRSVIRGAWPCDDSSQAAFIEEASNYYRGAFLLS